MSESDAQRVALFLADLQVLDPGKARIIEAVRDLFMQADPDLQQRIMYRGLVFLSDGALIGGAFPYSHHVSIEFSNGADFTDPSSRLQGRGQRRRHLKIHTVADLEATDAAGFIRQAVGRDGPEPRFSAAGGASGG
ncbi:DUF1801 domain-containing protein [Synechococcus sp. RSCCF101]|uniref:DUF1801 domain-containing protein n=1 Tax=Synechococcus sp. RSCCF101 TaxID=2511069 RepID=UPI001247C976|nr:DUF1801 domain-containing protein [Synechococcus sp. RSCCF101]QEY32719.1 DUF1801 domain-containing protein [Synechococcus sp. RSCCF101]